MKKESGQKKMKWLWLVIGIVVLLAAVGTVLAFVLPGLNSDSDDSAGRPDLYWNLDKATYLSAETNMSTREKAEDGHYYVRFAYNGEVLELPVSDKQLVNYIDSMDVMGLVMDADGSVVDAVPVKDIAIEQETGVFVQNVDGGKVYINSSVAMNGMKKELPITELVEIYDVTANAEVPGQIVTVEQLQPMDKLAVYANLKEQTTHVYVMSHARESKVYWRANQFTSGGKTTRKPDENGVYTIPFFCEGERVEFKCKNEVEVSYIDKQSRYSAHFGLVFDEEGYIEEAIHSYEAIRGTIRSERYDVTAIDGNKISTTKIIGSNAGTTDAFTLGDDCVIYDVSAAAQAEGRQGKPVESLQLGDRIVCFADADGEPLFVYVAERVVEDAIWCYNMERKYDTTLAETTRKPDAEGWYVFEVFSEGKVLKVRTQDKAIANQMDSVGSLVFGLTLNGDVVECVYTVYSVFGYGAFGQGRYVSGITGSIFTCFRSSAPDKAITGVMSGNCKVYNLSAVGTYGEETKLQVGDYIYAYQNPNLEVVQVFVIRRMVDAPVYYCLSRKYDSVNKVTKRVPDADGWYVFEMAVDGKITTVKTKSKALATKMDAISPPAMALVVGNGGVVYEAHEARYATGGYKRASGYMVKAINSDGTVETVSVGTATTATRILTLAEDCEIFNVSQIYEKNRGERTKLRVGDIITAYTDIYDKTALLYVRTREAEDLYWNTERMYDDTDGVTTRQPDAEGWYVYNLAVNGEVKTFKTQDKAIADGVDYYSGAFTLNVKDGVITCVASPSYAKKCAGTNLLNYDVVKVEGNKVTLQYHSQGSSKDGQIQQITLHSKVKIYDVSPTAEKFGAEARLQAGDRVRAYLNDQDDTYTYVYIRFHDSREKGADGYCDVCKKEVYWNPWTGGSFSTKGGHFYLPVDVQTSTLPCSTGRDTFPECTVCLDLNGHTYYRTSGRAMYVYKNATLNIMDTVGNGVVTSGGSKDSTTGGVLGISGGTVNLYSGTLRLAENHEQLVRAGVVYIGANKGTAGTLNMYGGKITGGEVLGRGGNICVAGGILNMYDGIIENGKVLGGVKGEHGGGGNIVSMSNAAVNIYGGVVTGGHAYAAGGNIYAGTGTCDIRNAAITDGVAENSGGGNIFAIGALSITDSTVSGGTSKRSGGNIHVSAYNEKTSFAAKGANIVGGVSRNNGGNIYCEVSGSLSGVMLKNGSAESSAGNLYAAGTTWELKDVTISGGTAKTSGGNMYVAGAKMALYNTTVSGGQVQAKSPDANAAGGNVYVSGGTFTMNGGVIKDGKVQGMIGERVVNENATESYPKADAFGGNIYLAKGATVNIVGGEVTDGTAVRTTINVNDNLAWDSANEKVVRKEVTIANNAYGGNIYLASTSGKLTVENATVSGGEAHRGGNIYGIGTNTFANAKILDGVATQHGANMFISNGTWTFTGDTRITGGKATAGGGNIYQGGGTVTVEKATIAGGTASSGGNIFMYRGETIPSVLNICDDALIQNGTATSSGGNIYLNGHYQKTVYELKTSDLGTVSVEAAKESVLDEEGKTLVPVCNITGGTVSGGVSDSGGGNVYALGEVNISGGTITGGTSNEKSGGNLYVKKDSAETGLIITGGVISDGTCAGYGGNIYTEGIPVAISNATISNGTSVNSGGNIYGTRYTLDNVTITGGTSEATGGSIYGSGNWQITNSIISGGNATGRGGNIYIAGGVWELNGTTISDGVSAGRGGNICIAKATVTMNSGAITGGTSGSADAYGGGNICTASNAVFNLVGGTIADGISANNGGNILAGSGQVNISGGEIRGGQAPDGSNGLYVYYSASNVTVTGGAIEHVIYTDAETFQLSGNPVIGLLEIAEGKLVTLGDLSDGADIAVSASGVFTTANENAESYRDDEIKLADSGKTLQVIGNQMGAYTIPAGAKLEPCPHCDGAGVLWYQWDGSTADGHFYLSDQMTVSEVTIPNGSKLVLDLSGKILENTSGRVFSVKGALAILDSASGGEMVGVGTDGGNGGVIHVNAGTFDLYSGTVRLAENAAAVKRGGVLYLTSGATANLRGGVVADGVSTERGGNVYMTGSTLNLMGATVTGGTSGTGNNHTGGGNSNGGGNICMIGGSTVNMTDGAVINGTSANTAGNILAGTGTLNISGGSISGGVAPGAAPNVYVYYKENDTTGSNAVITGGTIESVTYTNAVSFNLSGNPKIGLLTIGTGKTITLGELTAEAQVCVAANGVFTAESAYAQAAYSNNYITAAARHEISLVGETLSMGYVASGYCEHCDQDNVSWTAWDGASVNGHFYLNGNVETSTVVQVTAGNTLVLDLNGYKYNNTATRAFVVKGAMAVLDSFGTGEITAKGVADNYGGVIRVQGGTFDLYNGDLRLSKTHNAVKAGGVLSAESGATVNLRGGVIADGVTTHRAGNVYISGSSVEVSGTLITGGVANVTSNASGGGNICSISNGTLIISGGKVVNGRTGQNGGNIMCGSGNLTVSGGVISGGTADVNGADIYVYGGNNATVTGGSISVLTNAGAGSLNISGEPVIGQLELLDDGNGKNYLVAFGKLETNARIFMKPAVSGKVSEANGDLQAYLTAEYILPLTGDITLTVEGGNILSATVA